MMMMMKDIWNFKDSCYIFVIVHSCYRKVKKIKFGPEIFYGDNPDAVPYVQLSPLEDEIVASYTGPDSGLAFAEGHTENSK